MNRKVSDKPIQTIYYYNHCLNTKFETIPCKTVTTIKKYGILIGSNMDNVLISVVETFMFYKYRHFKKSERKCGYRNTWAYVDNVQSQDVEHITNSKI